MTKFRCYTGPRWRCRLCSSSGRQSAGRHRRCRMTRKWLAVVGIYAVATTAAATAQTRDLSRVMREKLDHAQKILEAVVTSNWAQLDAQSRELDRLPDDPRWTALKYPEYAKYSLACKHAVEDLRAAAERRDLQRTPTAYNTLTLRCIECHRYMARSRLAQ